jgi:predicted anti-sigma-YlaC factor YlaD
MAHHDSYQLLISLSLDEMLTSEEQNDLNEHLRDCALCAEMWSRMNTSHRFILMQPEIMPPMNFGANVMMRVEMLQMRRRWTPWMVVTLVIFSILASLSLAWPSLIFALGLDKRIAAWPITATLITAASDVLANATMIATLAVDALIMWVNFLASNPYALGVVIGALVLSSTYIGLREGMKAGRMMETTA